MPKALTMREREVLKLVAMGKRNREIGQILHISESTVEDYRCRAMLKLNLNSVVEVVRYAVRTHLIEA